MKYFLVEGIVKNPEKMTDQLMQEHQQYTGSLMVTGKVLFSSLKSDLSASVTVVKEETLQMIENFYHEEPFYKNDLVTYKISQLDIHYNYSNTLKWFK